MQYNTIYEKSLLYVVGHYYDEVRVWVFDLTEDDGQEHIFTYKIITDQSGRTVPVTDQLDISFVTWSDDHYGTTDMRYLIVVGKGWSSDGLKV